MTRLSPEPVHSTPNDYGPDEINLLKLANVVLKRWKTVAGWPIAFAIVTAGVSLVVPSKYTAITTFVPETSEQGPQLLGGLANLTGLASQFGLNLPGGSTSPKFYADLLRSRTLSDEILLTHFADPRGAATRDSAILLDLLRIKGDTESERLEKGWRKLTSVTEARVDNETSVVVLSVETRYPQLSADVANVYLTLLNRFNLETRTSNAQEQRRFIEERLAQADSELVAAEDDLQQFLERNRDFETSPELNFHYQRLQRQVTIKQQVFTTLRQRYEEARIQEVNDTPVITRIDLAVPPEKKSSPRRRVWVVLALVLGGATGTVIGFAREFAERARDRDDEDFEEFTSRWAAIGREIRSPFSRGHRS